MQKQEFKQYLSETSTSVDDKKYCMSFCNKMLYLDNLKQEAIKDVHEPFSSGYGNVNSRICFVFQNEDSFNIIKPLLQEILEKFNMHFWNVYVTFIDKCKTDYNKKYLYLSNELNAISPSVIYDIGCTNTNALMFALNGDEVTPVKVKYDKCFHIEAKAIASTEESVRRELWQSFKFLLNYKEIE